MASLELSDHENAQNCLVLFMKKFAKVVDLELMNGYSTDKLLNAFIKCFFHGKNDMDIFISVLQNPNVSIHELR
jgi:hypothetical protein